jgi:pilus assembly protein CpaE
MQQQTTGKGSSPFLWVGPGKAPDGRDLLERTASEFDLALDYCSYDDLPKKIGAAPWKLVAMDVGSAPDDGLARLKKLRQDMPRVCIFAAASQDHLDILPLALRNGASDFLSLPFSTTELNKALIKFSQHVESFAEVEGEVVCVYGARGGLGATTVAVTLAAHLARATRSEIGLLDLDVFRGDVSATLGLDATRSIGALAELHEIDQAALGRSLARGASDLLVLQAPPQFEDAELVTRDCVARVLELFKARCRFTVVDTARQLSEVSTSAFQNSDRVVLLTDLSIPGVRAAQRSLDLLSRFGIQADHIEVLMTELDRSGIKLEEVSKALGKREVTMLPRDPSVFGAAGSTTALGADTGSPFASVIAGLARRLSGERGSEAGKPLFKRLFGLGGRA